MFVFALDMIAEAVGRTALVSALVSSVGGGSSQAEHIEIPVIGHWRQYLVDRDAGSLEVWMHLARRVGIVAG